MFIIIITCFKQIYQQDKQCINLFIYNIFFLYISCATVYSAPGITKRSLYDREIHSHKELTQQLLFIIINYYFINRGHRPPEIPKKQGRTSESQEQENSIGISYYINRRVVYLLKYNCELYGKKW